MAATATSTTENRSTLMPPLERLARSIDLHSTSFGGGDVHAAPSGHTCPGFPPFVPGSLPRRPTGLSVSDASTQPVKKLAAGPRPGHACRRGQLGEHLVLRHRRLEGHLRALHHVHLFWPVMPLE